jgi:hypothetical protein
MNQQQGMVIARKKCDVKHRLGIKCPALHTNSAPSTTLSAITREEKKASAKSERFDCAK